MSACNLVIPFRALDAIRAFMRINKSYNQNLTKIVQISQEIVYMPSICQPFLDILINYQFVRDGSDDRLKKTNLQMKYGFNKEYHNSRNHQIRQSLSLLSKITVSRDYNSKCHTEVQGWALIIINIKSSKPLRFLIHRSLQVRC